jgi:carbonic anhydrase/acetyltransferase-like protein (isoleucine patch superfamily)
MLIYQDR